MPDEATWQEIERAYHHDDDPVTQIAARFEISASSIMRRAEKYGWPRRRAHPARSGHQATNSVAGARDTVVVQLYRRMSQRLTQMELATAADGDTPVDCDPDDRMLAQLIRQFEKLTGLDGISKRERAGGREQKPDAAAGSGARRSASRKSSAAAAGAPEQHVKPVDAERMRREIVERLERLHAERLARRDPGAS